MNGIIKKALEWIRGSKDNPKSLKKGEENAEAFKSVKSDANLIQTKAEPVGPNKINNKASSRRSEYKGLTAEKKVKKTKAPIDLIIGFDMGTSSTKVVVQAPDLQGNNAWVIKFGEYAYKEHKILLPTRVFYNKDKSITLKRKDESSSSYTSIKTGLFDNDEFLKEFAVEGGFEGMKEHFAAAYFGLALRFVRDYILNKEEVNFVNYDINWSLNVGIPSPTLGNFCEKERFIKVAKIGWKLSCCNGEITIESIKDEMKSYQENKEAFSSDLCGEVYLIPEIIAGSYGYALSHKRRNGLFIIVDIGSYTVDVCGFRLSRDRQTNENMSALFTAEVQPLGTYLLHRLAGNENYLQPVDEKRIKEKDEVETIGKGFQTTIRRTIVTIKKHRDPNAKEFKNGNKLPFIVIGGGSESQLYKNWINKINLWIKKEHIKNMGLDFISVPIPESITKDDVKYLTVAWGLSHRDLDIGNFMAPSDIKDIQKPNVDKSIDDLFISKDHV